MTVCRFENLLAGHALALYGLRSRIEVRNADELPAAFRAIDTNQKLGYWTALLLHYELGEWLEPKLSVSSKCTEDSPRLTALIFERSRVEVPWDPPKERFDGNITQINPRMDSVRYVERIEQIRQLIEEGKVYQINYTFPIDVNVAGDPKALYRYLTRQHPAAHAAYIHDNERHVLSFSPELFLSRRGGLLTCRPMKGTAPRHEDPTEDLRLAAELQASSKERAENLMIVDLMRSDLGRLARTGSVKVPKLFELERYPSIWTMTSTINADVGQATFQEILRALFPCGSVTGAPKIAAMSHIRSLEAESRGLYCGSIGWLAPNGDFSLNVAIRTLVVNQQGQGVYGVGGGIVMDSNPQQEWQECQWKSRILGGWEGPSKY